MSRVARLGGSTVSAGGLGKVYGWIVSVRLSKLAPGEGLDTFGWVGKLDAAPCDKHF